MEIIIGVSVLLGILILLTIIGAALGEIIMCVGSILFTILIVVLCMIVDICFFTYTIILGIYKRIKNYIRRHHGNWRHTRNKGHN